MAITGLGFAQTNLIETATLKNGSGGGAPALDQVSPWLVANAQNKSRSILWQQASGAGTFNVDFLYAAPAPTTLFALLGARGLPGSAVGIASCEVFTQTGAYTPGGTWTSRGTITMGSGVRDGRLEIASVTPASVRYAIAATTAFTLGRFFAGNFEIDLSPALYDPGRDRRRVDPDIRNEGIAQYPTIKITGDTFYLLDLPYSEIEEALRAKLEAVAALGRAGSFLMYDAAMQKIYECLMESSQGYKDGHLHAETGNFVWNSSLGIRTLG